MNSTGTLRYGANEGEDEEDSERFKGKPRQPLRASGYGNLRLVAAIAFLLGVFAQGLFQSMPVRPVALEKVKRPLSLLQTPSLDQGPDLVPVNTDVGWNSVASNNFLATSNTSMYGQRSLDISANGTSNATSGIAVPTAPLRKAVRPLPELDSTVNMDEILENPPPKVSPAAAGQPKLAEEVKSSRYQSAAKDGVMVVINTRLQIGQPDLLKLGLTRIEQLRSFLLPGIKNQTDTNFLWIIHTDSKLSAVLRRDIFRVMKGILNVVVVATDKGYPKDIRNEFYSKLKPSQVFFGSYSFLNHYINSYKSARFIADVRIDSDDGLYLGFVENLRQQIISDFGAFNGKGYRIYCAKKYMVWNYFHPFHATTYEKAKDGFITGHNETDICIPSGLTKVYTGGFKSKDLPTAERTLMHEKIPKCKEAGQVNCIQRIKTGKNYEYAALRSFAPSSATLIGVDPTAEKDQNQYSWKTKQITGWEIMKRCFNVKRFTVTNFRAVLKSNVTTVLDENIQGSCTAVHCSDASKAKMEEMLKIIGDYK